MIKKYTHDEIMSIAGLFNLADLPEENRTRVMKVMNPFDWFVISFNLSEFEGQTVKIKFSAEVKREGAAGTLRWQINNKNYPTVGRNIPGAKVGIWHITSGEWTGTLAGSPPVLYLSTWRNDSERTTFYIDKLKLQIAII